MAYQSNMMNNPQNPNWRGTSPFLGSAPRRSSRISSKYRPVTPAPSPVPSPTPAPAPAPAPGRTPGGWEFTPRPGRPPILPRPGTPGSPTPPQPPAKPWKDWFYNTPEMRNQPGRVNTTVLKPWQGIDGDRFMRQRWERANPEAAREYYRANPRMRPADPRFAQEIGTGYYTNNWQVNGANVPARPGLSGARPVAGLMPVRRQALDRIAGSSISLPRVM